MEDRLPRSRTGGTLAIWRVAVDVDRICTIYWIPRDFARAKNDSADSSCDAVCYVSHVAGQALRRSTPSSDAGLPRDLRGQPDTDANAFDLLVLAAGGSYGMMVG